MTRTARPAVGTLAWFDLTVTDAVGLREFYQAVVAELDSSLAACAARGGAVLAGPKSMGTARYAVIRDPAGAVVALCQA